MNINLKKSLWLIIMVLISCIVMAIIETIIEPTYFVKSVLKIVFFFIIPIVLIRLQKEKVFPDSFLLNKNSVLKLTGLGISIYAVVMGPLSVRCCT